MRKKLLFIGLLLAFATLLLTGCNPPEHECQFSSEWAFDQSNHWHACSGCEKTKDFSVHSFEIAITKQATCTEEGVQTLKCSVCGYTKTESIEKTADVHPYEKAWTTNSTHHWHKVTCIHDNQVMNYSVHNWGSWETVKSATSTEDGRKERRCIICGYTEAQVIEKTGSEHIHIYSENWSSDNTSHWHPATCEHSDLFTGKANHTFNSGTVTKAATTVEEGIMTYRCTVCGYEKTEPIPKVIEGHTHNFNIKNTDVKYKFRDADCENPALYYYSCSCGEHNSETFEYGNANGHKYSGAWTYNDTHHWHAAICEHSAEKGEYNEHNWGMGVVTLEPTTTSKGIKTFTCDTCGKTKTEEISQLEEIHVHQYNQQNIDDQYLNSEATCVAKATYFYSCSCGQKGMTTFEYGNFANHKFTNYISNGNATCTKDGTRTAICDVCKIATDEITDVGSAKGHSFSEDWTSDDTHHWHASTCGHTSELSNKETHHWNEGVVTKQPTEITEGEKTYTCDICHKTKVERIGKLDHIHTFASEYSFDDNYHWYSATCIHISEVKNKESHSWNKGVIISQSTVYDEGIKLYTCQDCGHTKEETIDKMPSFTVVFFDSENRIVSKNNYELNTASSQVVIPTIQEEAGVQFEKWINVYDSKSIEEIDFSQAQKDSVYQFKPSFVKIHDVIFIDYNGNQLGKTLAVKDGDKLLKSDLPTIPFRDGYKSTWDEQILNTKITETKIFEPIYEVLTYKVEFLDAKNGNLISTEIVEYGSFAITPECELYQFISNKLCGFSGWKSSATDMLAENVVGNKVIDVHSDLTLYAAYGVSIEQPVLAAHIDGTIMTMTLCMPNDCSLYSVNISMGWETKGGICEITGASISTVTPLNKGNCGEENCTVFTDKNDWLVYNNKAKTVDFIWNCGNGHSFSTSANVITLIFGVDDGAEINETIFSMLTGSRIVYGKNGTDINDLKQSNIMVWFY